jgi:hypothetical protein
MTRSPSPNVRDIIVEKVVETSTMAKHAVLSGGYVFSTKYFTPYPEQRGRQLDIPTSWHSVLRIPPRFVPFCGWYSLQLCYHVCVCRPRHVRVHLSPPSCFLRIICWPPRFHSSCPSRPWRIICDSHCHIQGVLFRQGTG